MDKWIEHLNSPLVLIGFMLFVVAGIVKLLLRNNLIKINQANSAKLISKTLNYLFILALVGMMFGFFSQKDVLQTLPKPETKTTAPAKPPTQIKQTTEGDSNKTAIEQVDLTDKNIEQTVKGNHNSAVISGVNAESKK